MDTGHADDGNKPIEINDVYEDDDEQTINQFMSIVTDALVLQEVDEQVNDSITPPQQTY